MAKSLNRMNAMSGAQELPKSANGFELPPNRAFEWTQTDIYRFFSNFSFDSLLSFAEYWPPSIHWSCIECRNLIVGRVFDLEWNWALLIHSVNDVRRMQAHTMRNFIRFNRTYLLYVIDDFRFNYVHTKEMLSC